MRIPSQFNRDSLYRRDNRHRESTDNLRRLLRLIIGLALVVVIMRQASRPALYQTFFDPSLSAKPAALQRGHLPPSPSQDPLGSPESATSDGAAGQNGDRDGHSGGTSSSLDRQAAAALIEDLLPSDQRQWVVALSHWQTGRNLPIVPSTIESIRERLRSLDSLDESQRASWEAMLEEFDQAVASSQPGEYEIAPPDADEGEQGGEMEQGSQGPTDRGQSPRLPSEAIAGKVAALLAALDAAANARVVDGSVWRSGDFDSLYRFLDQAERLPRSGVAAVGVLPLLQQPEVFRNQWVRFHGSVAKTERVRAQENPFGVTHYWQLWLRPADGVNRPLVAIVPRVPETVAAVGPQTTTTGPDITVVGRYLKRLAYQSAIGADLAPVVVGQITSAPISEQERSQLEQNAASEPSAGLGWPILLACLLGIGFAVFVMWNTAASAKRSRQLRQSHAAEPDDFLQQLGDETTAGGSSNEGDTFHDEFIKDAKTPENENP